MTDYLFQQFSMNPLLNNKYIKQKVPHLDTKEQFEGSWRAKGQWAEYWRRTHYHEPGNIKMDLWLNC